MKILITGTPGVGKTTLSKKIANELNIEHIDISEFIVDHKLAESYDQNLDTNIFDEDSVIHELSKYIENKNSFIVDTHSPVVAIDINFDFIFHLVCDTGVLWKRLDERKYSTTKIDENIQSEIFNIIGEEISEYFSKDSYLINGSKEHIEGVEYDTNDVLSIIRGLKQ